ncbi:MAG TPA: nuclear transport factor 2 family protein [Gaiellaceae bacterium]|nr:nuclear transport factor 2 family protein [Gaiellaceae bacterium]
MTAAEFRVLLKQLACAWSTQDTELALSCFAEDAVYSEPPDVQLYSGHDELRPYFAALTPDTRMAFHTTAFDEMAQRGFGEYTFGSGRGDVADHGVAVCDVAGDRIAAWREYQRKGPAAFEDFIATEGKTWQWHIGNYP